MQRATLTEALRPTQSSDVRRRCAATIVLVWLVVGWIEITSGGPSPNRGPSEGEWQLARHRSLGIPLPDGSTLLLRREYRAYYRALVLSQDGLVLDKAYHASRVLRDSQHRNSS